MIYILPTDTCFWMACSIDDTVSYHKIYEIKKRPLSKPLSIMVPNFLWLKKNTTLNDNQIEFLKNYNKPFTILTNSPIIKMILNLEQKDFNYKNKEVYKKIAFRVAHNDIQKKLINDIWPIFLTSANFSWKKEIYDAKEVKNEFKDFKKEIIFLWDDIVLLQTPPSDIFYFIWDSNQIKYIRN